MARRKRKIMNKELLEEIEALGGNTADPIWQWLLNSGPHGPGFTWSQTRREPAGHVGVELLRRIVEEKAQLQPSFCENAKVVVSMGLKSTNPNVLKRAIQVTAVLGGDNELETISALTKHENSSVASDARASVFYLKTRLRSM